MANLTVRNIPDEILDKIRVLSEIERRSLNNQILIILENGLNKHEKPDYKKISPDTRLSILKDTCGTWKDSRQTGEIIKDIYRNRTKGRAINL